MNLGWWRRYWFGAGDRHGAAALRIAVGVSVLWLLYQLRGHASAPPPDPGAFRPLGILRLLPFVPGPTLLQLTWVVAVGSTLAMIVGLRSRLATVVSLVTALVLCSNEYARVDHWSHDLNASLLAQLALLGARTGDAWSIDAWRRRRRGEPAETGHAYLWAPRLVQLSLALMMASAGFSKLVAGGMSLDWALSDNLRHQILVRFDLGGVPRTALAAWILEEPLRWKLAALGNLVAQLAPLVAVFAIRRPWVRAACGAIFATEVLGLWLVMGFWNPWWFPLAAAFIDWDRLVAWQQARRAAPPPATEAAPVVGRATRGFVGAYVALYVVVGFWHWPLIDQRLNLYPFTSFPMFASIRAVPPYDTHQRYEVLEAGFAVETSAPAPALAAWVARQRRARALSGLPAPEVVRAHIAGLRGELAAVFPEVPIGAVRVILRAHQAPPHPAPARFEPVEIATIAVHAADDTFTYQPGRLVRDGARWAITGLPTGAPRLATYRHGTLTEPPRSPTASAGWSSFPGELHVLAWRGERWWLVAHQRR